MATLTDDELDRIRREVLDTVLDAGMIPYVSIRAIYDLIRTNVSSSSTAATSSSTAVTAAGATTLTVASASGLAVGYKVVLDVDDQREVCTVKSLSGTTLGVNARKTHSGTYPVEIESALTLVRGVLWDLSRVQDELNTARDGAGIKRVDEVEFFEGVGGSGPIEGLRAEQQRLRGELARMLGISEILRAGRSAGGTLEVY